MIVAKFLNAAHNLVEQKDIKETVIGGGSLAKILNWLAPRRKVVLAC